jgi:uncharacterized membrane protein
MKPENVRATALGLLICLIALVAAWQLSMELATGRMLAAVVLTLPLWAPLRGLLRNERRTYAWATLCVIPYFILGTTEAIANPEHRTWAGLCLLLALMLFVSLILYLRVTNPARGPRT